MRTLKALSSIALITGLIGNLAFWSDIALKEGKLTHDSWFAMNRTVPAPKTVNQRVFDEWRGVAGHAELVVSVPIDLPERPSK